MSALRQASRFYKEVWNLPFVLQKSGFSRRGYWSDQVKLVMLTIEYGVLLRSDYLLILCDATNETGKLLVRRAG